jgi:hypothetical protein
MNKQKKKLKFKIILKIGRILNVIGEPVDEQGPIEGLFNFFIFFLNYSFFIISFKKLLYILLLFFIYLFFFIFLNLYFIFLLINFIIIIIIYFIFF